MTSKSPSASRVSLEGPDPLYEPLMAAREGVERPMVGKDVQPAEPCPDAIAADGADPSHGDGLPSAEPEPIDGEPDPNDRANSLSPTQRFQDELPSSSVNPAKAAHSPFRKHLRLARLTALIAEQKIFSLLCTGSPGVGKSHTVVRVLEEHGLKAGTDFTLASGHASPLGIYTLLFAHKERGRVLLLDDNDEIFSSSPNLIKAVTDTKAERAVSFASSRLQDLPQSFVFAGAVIFLTNVNLTTSKNNHLLAISSRMHHVDLTLDRAEILAFIKEKVLPAPHGNLSLADREHVFYTMLQAASASTSRLDARKFHQLCTLFESDRENYDLHIESMFEQSPELLLMRRMLAEQDRIEDAAAAWMAATKKSRSAFFLAKKRFAEWL